MNLINKVIIYYNIIINKIESFNVMELKKKYESQKKVIDEYENWLMMLLNIIEKSKYRDYNPEIESVKFLIYIDIR
jgi:hypothetical protein